MSAGRRARRANAKAAKPAKKTPREPRRFYSALDGWRGVCACLVALFHFRSPWAVGWRTNAHLTDNPVVASAYLFTDFFFVLSGFVITANYAERMAADGGIRRFLSLRLARIWPLQVASLGLVIAIMLGAQLAVQITGGEPFRPFEGGATVWVTFVLNVFLLHAWHLWSATSWNRPSWSISAEFAVYVLFAWAMRWPRLVRRGAMALVLVGAPVLIYLAKGDMDVTFDWGVPRALFGFVIGALVYESTIRFDTPRWLRPRWVATTAEIIAIAASAMFVARFGGTPVSILAPVVFAVAVWLLALEGGDVSAICSRPPLRQLGRWSYSIYMLQYPVQLVLVLCGQLWVRSLGAWLRVGTANGRPAVAIGVTPWQGDLVAAGMLVALVAAASISYRVVESPPRRWMRARLAGR